MSPPVLSFMVISSNIRNTLVWLIKESRKQINKLSGAPNNSTIHAIFGTPPIIFPEGEDKQDQKSTTRVVDLCCGNDCGQFSQVSSETLVGCLPKIWGRTHWYPQLSSIFRGFSMINHPAIGVSSFIEHPIYHHKYLNEAPKKPEDPHDYQSQPSYGGFCGLCVANLSHHGKRCLQSTFFRVRFFCSSNWQR